MTNEELVQDWESGLTGKEIAMKHSVPESMVRGRVWYLRKKGVRLSSRPQGARGNVNVDALNSLIEAKGAK